MLERKKEERKLSVGAFFLQFFGVFLAIVDGIVAIVSVVLLSIGQNFRWEMLLLAAGCLMAALAAWLAIRAGLKRNKLLTELRRYRRLLDSNPSGDIRQMAQLMNKPLEQAEQELEKLIRLKCFPPEVYLDKDSGRLRLPASLLSARQAAPAAPAAPGAPSQPEEFVIVVCSECGAVNRVPKGKTMKCQGPGCKAQLSGQPPQEKSDILSRL